jgi:hypothetical protein
LSLTVKNRNNKMSNDSKNEVMSKKETSKPSKKVNKKQSNKEPEPISFSFTITFGDVAENGPGMKKHGTMKEPGQGFTTYEMLAAKQILEKKGVKCEILDLNDALPKDVKAEDANIMIIRDACAQAYNVDPVALREEIKSLHWDQTKLMRGKEKTSRARRNVCFGPEDIEADIENGQGTVVSWNKVPLLKKIRDTIAQDLGTKAKFLQGEGNFYFHVKGGIGLHGDSERRIVIAIRLGEPLRFHFQWFHKYLPIGNRITIDDIVEGDMYIMSEKATGWDWRKSSTTTLRHAAERFHDGKQIYCKSLDQLNNEGENRKRKRETNKKNKNINTKKTQKTQDNQLVDLKENARILSLNLMDNIN